MGSEPETPSADDVREAATWLLFYASGFSSRGGPATKEERGALSKALVGVRRLRERVDALHCNRYLARPIVNRMRAYYTAKDSEAATHAMERVGRLWHTFAGRRLTAGQAQMLARDETSGERAKAPTEPTATRRASRLLGIEPRSLHRLRAARETAPIQYWLRGDVPNADYTARHEAVRFFVRDVLKLTEDDFRNVLAVLDMLPQDNAPEGARANIPAHPRLQWLRDTAQNDRAIRAPDASRSGDLLDCGPEPPA